MKKKHYILIGSVLLAIVLCATSALILATKNLFDGSADKNANPYTNVSMGKILAQSWAFDGKDLTKWEANQATMEKARKFEYQADSLAQDKHYQAAIEAYREALTCLQTYPGLGCLQAVEILTEKAKCEDQLGLTVEREKTLRQLLQAATDAYNAKHMQVAIALESLGDLLCSQDRQSEALPLIERAYQIRVDGAGFDNGDTAWTISQLAHCNLDLKNYKQADELYKKAITIYEKLDGDGFSESQQIARENLANSYRWQNRYKEAMDSELTLLDELEKKHLGNTYYAASALTSAASTAQSEKDTGKMREYLSRAEKIAAVLEPGEGEQTNNKADLYKDIAEVYDDDDDYKSELNARVNSVNAFKSIKYPQQDDQINLAQNLVRAGSCALKLKDYGKAQEYFGQALSQARDNQEIRLKLKSNKEEIQEYLKYIERDRHATQDPTIKMQASEFKQMLLS